MSVATGRSSGPERPSVFFRDLASPASSAHRGGGGGAAAGRFSTPGQVAAVSALWRENFGAASDPPPPPAFTLDDRADFSPEPGLAASPEATPPQACGGALLSFSSPSPFKAGGSGGVAAARVVEQQQSPGSAGWLSAARRGEEKGKGSSPVDAVVQSGALIMLPPPREVARPELQRSSLPPGGLDEEEWVTVYGFSPGDTDLVLHEFEKCGVIVKHIPGPRDANWMHILYQNCYDAQKALGKNGMQINSVLIVGVKPMDRAQHRFLDDKLNGYSYGGFMASLPPRPAVGESSAALRPLVASAHLYYVQNGRAPTADSDRRSAGAIASPTKSVVSKVMDLMFGI